MVIDSGTILYAECLDTERRNPKVRPLLVVSIPVVGQPLNCVAISTQYNEPPRPVEVILPHANPGQHRAKCHTGLTRPSVAVCDWLVQIAPGQEVQVVGHVKQLVLAQVAIAMRRATGPDDDSESSSGLHSTTRRLDL